MKFKDTEYGDLTGQTYEGDIDVNDLNLTSLEGSPKVINGNFFCYNNQLTSLEGSPEVINGSFFCYNNQLTSLTGSPEVIEGHFACEHNPNKNLTIEYQIRKENPNLPDDEIFSKMMELGYTEYYLPNEAKDIFVF